jgi:hypothetical protein
MRQSLLASSDVGPRNDLLLDRRNGRRQRACRKPRYRAALLDCVAARGAGRVTLVHVSDDALSEAWAELHEGQRGACLQTTV